MLAYVYILTGLLLGLLVPVNWIMLICSMCNSTHDNQNIDSA